MAQEGRLRAFRKTPWITNSEIATQLLLTTLTLQSEFSLVKSVGGEKEVLLSFYTGEYIFLWVL